MLVRNICVLFFAAALIGCGSGGKKRAEGAPCEPCDVCDDNPSNECARDCAGEPGGAAYRDECGACVGGDTGLEPCTRDCNGSWGGSAFLDECETCVGGDTGLAPCTLDCNGTWGGSAVLDECETCVGGDTGLEPCTQDCNGTRGGSAFLDECVTCVGGDTGLEPCTQDCNGTWGGSAFLDECGTCVDGDTGLEPCTLDCTGELGGAAWVDGCGVCVGGETGREACDVFCAPFAVSLARQGHAREGHEAVHTDQSFYAVVDQVNAADGLAYAPVRLTLPRGTHDITFRMRGGVAASPLSLFAEPEFPAGCSSVSSIEWAPDAQPARGRWGVSPPLRVTVHSSGYCVIQVSLTASDAVTRAAFDWVRATPACTAANECPRAPLATANCVEGQCVYESPDSDDDGFCDAMDVCDREDDRIDGDRDGVPAGCDVDDEDPLVNGRSEQGCGPVDHDGNGIGAPAQEPGTRIISLTDLDRAHAQHFTVEASDESVFDRVLQAGPALWWLEMSGGPVFWLQPGRYAIDFRVAPIRMTAAIHFNTHAVGGRGCVSSGPLSWVPQPLPGDWQISSPHTVEITAPDCKVQVSVRETTGVSKSGWRFDWARIRRMCQVDADCPSLGGGTAPGVCRDWFCAYDAECVSP